MPAFKAAHFNNDEAARKHLEGIRWPEGPICPHCGTINHAYATKRAGVYRCAEAECRKDFSVTIGTIFERSHIPLSAWFKAIFLLCSSKKGMSAHQMHRMLGVTYKTAWFMCHRIREAMKGANSSPLGGTGKTVEGDETYFGSKDVIRKRTIRGKASHSSKRSVVALVERGGSVRSFHVERADKQTVSKIVRDNVARESTFYTDESRLYGDSLSHVKAHDTVIHSRGEYVRGDIHTNTVEGFFSVFKRGMKGCYQHCSEKHLHRYLAEFDFRYNNRTSVGVNDDIRAHKALLGTVGKRMYYRQPS
jgi:transposase-like protein